MGKTMIGALLLVLTMMAGAAEKIVPAGTYGNLLQNSKLEVLVGNFPTPWNNSAGRCTFVPESGPNGGGVFKIGPCKSIVVIRQDWSFTLSEKLQYRLSAKVRTSRDFKAKEATLMVFNNGWSKTAPIAVTSSDDTGWRTISQVITAPPSPGGLYSVGIVARNVESGTWEIADITLEPATAEAQEAQTAWLKGLPLKKLHIFGISKGIMADGIDRLSGRWFGSKNAKAEYQLDQIKTYAPISMDANGFFQLPKANLKAGKHQLRIRIDGKVYETNFLCLDYPNRKVKRLNNLNVQIAEINATPGKQAQFALDREAPVLFQMKPDTMTIKVDGGTKSLKNGEWIRLKEGVHSVSASGQGTVWVHQLADTVYYQLNHGPYLTGLPMNNLAFARRNLMGAVTVFFNPAITADQVAKEIRPSGAIALHMCPMDKFKQFNPDQPLLKSFDGIGVDEYASTSPKPLAEHFTTRRKLKKHSLKIWPWECGTIQDNEIQAEFESILCEAGDVLLYEAYVKSNLNDETAARKNMLKTFIEAKNMTEKVHPGFVRNLALITSQGNVPLSFTTDNNPAVDYKYFLDMQFNIWANDPAFQHLAAVGTWGGSYADRECNAWVAALFRHYVMEGKTTMLSTQYGFTFHPGILKNCAFADGLKEWTVKGQVTAGTSDGYCSTLKRFGGIPVDAESCAEMGKDGVLSQSLKNLKKGKIYRIRMMTTGEVPEVSFTGVEMLADKNNVFFIKTKPGERGSDVYFRANGASGEITLTAKKGKCIVHYLCATPCFEFNDISAMAEKKETNERLSKELKSFLIRRKGPNGPGVWFENMKGEAVENISAMMTHDGTNLRMVLSSPADTAGTWEIHSAITPADGELLILSIDAQGTVQATSTVRANGGMPSKQVTSLSDVATASVAEANGVRTLTVTIPLAKVKTYGLIPGKQSRMNFFYITEKQVVGWNPTFKPERRLPWRLGRVYLEK